MGGGSSLLAADDKRFLDSPDFPAAWRENATGQADALDFYRTLAPSSLNWSYISPPPIHFAPGERTGRYRTGEDHPVVGERGESRISYEDLAVAVVDEIERPRFVRKRFTVGY
jgi:putative NADH-flavin reductase